MQFMNVAFMMYIVDQSSLNASQRGQTLDLTFDELEVIFGMLVIPSLRLYWSDDHNFHVPRIAKIILYTIRPFIQHLNQTFKKSFNSSHYFLIDEIMIRFKGRSSIKQYLPIKPIKSGFKVWVVACGVSGYMINFEIYEGTLGKRTVVSLAKSFETLGCCLFFYRFFSSITLLRTLLFGCGTIMQNRKHFPKNLLKTYKDLKFGDSDYTVCGEISVTKWKDRGIKSVVVVTNMHNPENSSTVERKGKYGNKQTVTCPTLISDYNM
ncbi:hypothetical protein PR048_005049 [Dryococelus australis]|uniref:PiggyBac transposable element-derived protein domain-containing protein n=1 Tax=Dryococelus australis TaxID=614101 RepID=A0ABQ9I749_9NEOP|nr:hypothetical protein PR048_005049 [Dryococelus australis]